MQFYAPVPPERHPELKRRFQGRAEDPRQREVHSIPNTKQAPVRRVHYIHNR
jgi:hypothetical protein